MIAVKNCGHSAKNIIFIISKYRKSFKSRAALYVVGTPGYFFICIPNNGGFYELAIDGSGWIADQQRREANKCMLMAAIAYNLKKLLKFSTRKVQINVPAKQVKLLALFLSKTSLHKPIYFFDATLFKTKLL